MEFLVYFLKDVANLLAAGPGVAWTGREGQEDEDQATDGVFNRRK
jgi:hypothetical protein